MAVFCCVIDYIGERQIKTTPGVITQHLQYKNKHIEFDEIQSWLSTTQWVDYYLSEHLDTIIVTFC